MSTKGLEIWGGLVFNKRGLWRGQG